MRIAWAAFLLLLLLCFSGLPAPAGERALDPACEPPSAPAETVETAEFDAANLVRLADGRHVRLAGLDAATLRSTMVALPGRAELRPVGLPDRHGTLAVDLRAGDLTSGDAAPAATGDAAVTALALVAAGAARVRPRPGEPACFTALLAAEDRARQAGLGLWADPGYAVLDASDEAAVAQWLGRYAIVQGRIRHVGTARERIYLDFGPVWRTDVTATIAPRALARFRAAGVDPMRLEGQVVRVRGTVSTAGGPALALADPAALEIVADAPAPESVSVASGPSASGPAAGPARP